MKRKVSHYQTVAEIAYGLAKQHLPRYRHKNSPYRFTWPQLSACVLLTFYLNFLYRTKWTNDNFSLLLVISSRVAGRNLAHMWEDFSLSLEMTNYHEICPVENLDYSYRDMEDWLWVSDRICQVLDLQEIPDHSTLCRAFHKLDIRLLRALQRLLLQRMSIREMTIAVDSTGFSPDQSSAYYSFRNGRPKRDWVKGAYAVGTQSQLILGHMQVMGAIKTRFCSKACVANPEYMHTASMCYVQMPVLMAGKSSLATLFRLSEDMARCAHQTGLSALNWLRRLVSMVFMDNAGSAKQYIRS